jgi:hypothetical protein
MAVAVVLATAGALAFTGESVLDALRGVFSLSLGAVDTAVIWSALTAQFQGIEAIHTPELDARPERARAAVLECSKQTQAALKFARYLAAPDAALLQRRGESPRPRVELPVVPPQRPVNDRKLIGKHPRAQHTLGKQHRHHRGGIRDHLQIGDRVGPHHRPHELTGRVCSHG